MESKPDGPRYSGIAVLPPAVCAAFRAWALDSQKVFARSEYSDWHDTAGVAHPHFVKPFSEGHHHAQRR